MKKLKAERRESEEEIRSQGEIIMEGGTYGYLDDAYVVNDAKVTAINTPKLALAYEAHNATLCVEKVRL